MDATQLYFKEIRAYPLLTVDEEICLAKRVGQGNEAARKRMIECNLRLVVKIARGYCKDGVQLNDLIQEGNLGLMEAVEKFDPDRGCRFSTYAFCCIKYAIGKAIREQGNIISLSDRIVKDMNECLRAVSDLTKKLQREPTAKEIAKSMNKPIDYVRKMLNLYNSLKPVELPSECSDNAAFVESLPDERPSPSPSLADAVAQEDFTEKCLEALSNKQYEVIVRYFGYEECFESIGKDVNLTGEAIRQIHIKIIKKLKKKFEPVMPPMRKAA